MHRISEYKTRLYETPDDAHDKSFKSYGTELLYGEKFKISAIQKDWAKGESIKDGYEGWINIHHVAPYPELNSKESIAIVNILEAPLYALPHLKSKTIGAIPFYGQIRVDEAKSENNYIYAPHEKAWLNKHHVIMAKDVTRSKTCDEYINGLIAIAQKFLNCPYVFGGCSALGIDCSALVQLSMGIMGIELPRDSTPQKEYLNNRSLSDTIQAIEVEPILSNAMAGDIIFLPGHVGIALNDNMFIHASSQFMQVCVQPLKTVHEYYQDKEGQGITAIRRLSDI